MQILKRLAAAGKRQGVPDRERNHRLRREDGQLEKKPREIPEHDAVDTVALKREENAENHHRVPEEIGAGRQGEAVLAQQKGPEDLRESSGNDDGKEPLAKRRREHDLRGGEARSQASNHPRRRGGACD